MGTAATAHDIIDAEAGELSENSSDDEENGEFEPLLARGNEDSEAEWEHVIIAEEDSDLGLDRSASKYLTSENEQHSSSALHTLAILLTLALPLLVVGLHSGLQWWAIHDRHSNSATLASEFCATADLHADLYLAINMASDALQRTGADPIEWEAAKDAYFEVFHKLSDSLALVDRIFRHNNRKLARACRPAHRP